MKKLTSTLVLVLVASLFALPALAASDWSMYYSTAVPTLRSESRFTFRTLVTATSEPLDVTQCTAGDFGYKWDPSATDASDVARGWLLGCVSTTQPTSECTRVATLGASQSPNNQWLLIGEPNPTARLFPYFRAQIVTAPTGGDTAVVEILCKQDISSEAGLVDRFYNQNKTTIDFQDVRQTSCNNASCTPNDPLTPFWVRQAIGAAVADTFVQSSTYQLTGEAILDPGTSASTGVQYNLPAAQSLLIIESNRLKIPPEQFYFRAAFWRTGATAVLGVGLCGTTAAGAADPLITTAGALSASGEFIGVKWDTGGTFTSGFRGSSSGIQTKTTTETAISTNYHEVVIRPLIRNIGLDVTGGLDLSGADDASGGIVIEIDGIRHDIITDDDIGLPSLSTKQLSPCISAVNVGGTADVANFADIDWFTDKQRAYPDDN